MTRQPFLLLLLLLWSSLSNALLSPGAPPSLEKKAFPHLQLPVNSIRKLPTYAAVVVPPLYAAGSDDYGDDDNATSILKGFERREIRALANKLKFTNKLQCTSLNVRDISANARSNIESLLLSDELLQVKLNVEKKKEAKEIGSTLARSMNCELVQTIGHSVLLYRPGARALVQAMLEEQRRTAGANTTGKK